MSDVCTILHILKLIFCCNISTIPKIVGSPGYHNCRHVLIRKYLELKTILAMQEDCDLAEKIFFG